MKKSILFFALLATLFSCDKEADGFFTEEGKFVDGPFGYCAPFFVTDKEEYEVVNFEDFREEVNFTDEFKVKFEMFNGGSVCQAGPLIEIVKVK